MAKRKQIKKVCEICRAEFWTAWETKDICPECTEFRQKCRASSTAIHGSAKLTSNMAAIERVNRKAEAQGLSYGKAVGQEYAQEHVRVVRKERNNE